MKDGIKTKWTGKANKGIAAHEVFFLWPFIMGSYSGSTHLNLTKVQTAETRKYFIDMMIELDIRESYPCTTEGELLIPKHLVLVSED